MTYEETKFFYDEYYSNGISTVKLAKMFGHDPCYFSHSFNKYGFAVRSNRINSRKYNADFDYFEKIDTHEKAYWLGFIYADGYISITDGTKRFGVALNIDDKDHLEKLNRCLNSTYPIKEYTEKSGYSSGAKYCRLIITNSKMCDDLKSNGVYEHKSEILDPPNINPEFYNSFILGYFDGDGSIYQVNSKKPSYSMSIVGTDSVLTFIHSQLEENNAITKKLNLEKRRPTDVVSYIRYGGMSQIKKIYDYLYKDIDSNLPLQRKRDLFVKCANDEF